MHRLFENYKLFNIKTPIAVTADAQTTGVDLGPDQLDDVMVILSLGDVTGTSPTCQIDMETSDLVSGTYTVADGGAFPSYDNDDENSVKSLALNMQGENSNGETQRFLRANIDVGGTTPSFLIGIVALVLSQVGKEDLNSSAAA